MNPCLPESRKIVNSKSINRKDFSGRREKPRYIHGTVAAGTV